MCIFLVRHRFDTFELDLSLENCEHKIMFHSGGAKGLQDSSNEVLIMATDYSWSKFGQNLRQSRRDHITLVKGTLVELS